MDNFTKKQQIGILILVVILLFSGKFVMDGKNKENNKTEKIVTEKEEKKVNDKIKVHIKGAVKTPGVYDMDQDSRINDLVEKAEGFLVNADKNKVFLAKKIKDEETIHIPFIGENEEIIEDTSSKSDKININIATKEELKELNGIGDATADKIIEYRKKEKFENIEDIMNISGIGEKKFENIRENIVV